MHNPSCLGNEGGGFSAHVISTGNDIFGGPCRGASIGVSPPRWAHSFKKGKKSNTDYRKTGLVTIFTGVGLAAFGYYGLKTDIVFGVGLLVMFIGVGQIIAGYVYPNQPDEINNAVENFEKR